MALNLSIAQMLAKLDTKVAHHEERKAFHAEQFAAPVCNALKSQALARRRQPHRTGDPVGRAASLFQGGFHAPTTPQDGPWQSRWPPRTQKHRGPEGAGAR
jgi:hypothetical protein